VLEWEIYMYDNFFCVDGILCFGIKLCGVDVCVYCLVFCLVCVTVRTESGLLLYCGLIFVE